MDGRAGGPRDGQGRFVKRRCPDPNCGGAFVPEREDWRCDGLTHRDRGGPLFACPEVIQPPWMQRMVLP